jgi:O-antigen/teichoic acid export membrane protein
VSEPAGIPRRTVGAGATLAVSSQVVSAVTGGALGIVVARLLGPDGTGEFNLVLTSTVVLTVVCSLGVEVGLNYRVSGGAWSAAAALRQAQLAALVLGGVGAALGIGLAVALEDSLFRGVSLTSLAVGVGALPFALSWTYSSFAALATDRYEAYATAIGAQNVVALLLGGGLGAAFGVTGAVAGVSASHAAVALGIYIWGARAFGSAPIGWLQDAVARLRDAAAFGLRANVGNILQLFNYRADLFVLNAFVSQGEVGRYAVATSVTALGQLMPRALASVVMPRVAALDAGTERAALDMVVVKSVRHAVLMALAMSVVLAAGLLLVPLVYGSEFEGAIVLGLLLIPGISFIAVGAVLSSTIVGKGKPQYSLYNVLMVTPVTLGLYAALIPALGAVGAALASSVSYIATTVVAWFYFRRVTGLSAGALRPGADELRDYRALIGRIRVRARSGRAGSG